MQRSTSSRTLIDRMIGAALLQGDVYEEVEHDEGALWQAALVVVLGAVAAGIGGLLAGPIVLAVAVAAGLVGWGAYAYTAYWVGTNWFKGPQTDSTWGELLRTLGFANAPRLLLVVGIVPIVGIGLGFIVMLWTLATTIVAIRHALDFDLGSAVVTAVVSWLVLVLVSFVVANVLAAVI